MRLRALDIDTPGAPVQAQMYSRESISAPGPLRHRRSGRRAPVSIVLILIVTVLAGLLPGTQAAARTARAGAGDAGPLVYIALGDSIASGHGLAVAPDGACQRSDAGYPERVRLLLAEQHSVVTLHHLACSGARAVEGAETDARITACRATEGRITDADRAAFNTCDALSLAAQVDLALSLIAERPEGAEVLVSITIGINDAQWSDPVALTRLLLATDDAFHERADALAQEIGAGVRAQVQRLLQEDIAPNDLTIVLTDYYQPFNAGSMIFSLLQRGQQLAWGSGSSDQPCVGTDRDGGTHTRTCAERVRLGLQELHDAFERIASREPRVVLAPLLGRFSGHEAAEGLCGTAATSGESWVQTNAYSGVHQRIDCFHPNELGAQQIAQVVVASSSWVQPWSFAPGAGFFTQ